MSFTVKKSVFKKIAGIVALALGLGVGFTSCHDNIYGMIEMEVKQEEGLNGDIYQIVPFNGYLWCSNYNLYKKDATPSAETGSFNGGWSKVDTGLSFIASIATDGTYLYCYTIEWKEDEEDSINRPYYKRVYSSPDGENWTQIDISSVTGCGSSEDSYAEDTRFKVFDNRAGDGSNSFTGRKAYVFLYNASAEAMEVHVLNGTSLGGVPAGSGSSFSAAYFNGTTYFGNRNAMVANNTCIYRNSVADTDTKGSLLEYSSNGTDWNSVNLGHGTIFSLALTSDYLLVGTAQGIYRVALTGGLPASSVSDFTNNAQSLLTSRVIGLYVLNSSLADGESDAYATMTISSYLSSSPDTFKEIGLYAYYPGRGVWNRDGDEN